MKGSGHAGLTVAIAACLALACSPPRRPAYEEPPLPQPSAPSEAPQPRVLELPPPRPDEVIGVVKRVFGRAAVGSSGGRARVLVGDFNGDLSQDIAVVVRPAPGQLDEMNAEYPRWMLKDPLVPPGAGTRPLRVQPAETLLAIIHGNGPDGWRDPEATQTYLLKNAVGSDLEVHAGRTFVAANQGRKIPRIHGDVIGQVLRGTPGYLYYTGPTYSWYDPKTFTGEPEAGLFHGRRRPASQ